MRVEESGQQGELEVSGSKVKELAAHPFSCQLLLYHLYRCLVGAGRFQANNMACRAPLFSYAVLLFATYKKAPSSLHEHNFLDGCAHLLVRRNNMFLFPRVVFRKSESR